MPTKQIEGQLTHDKCVECEGDESTKIVYSTKNRRNFLYISMFLLTLGHPKKFKVQDSYP